MPRIPAASPLSLHSNTGRSPSPSFGAGAGTLNFNHTSTSYTFAPAIGGNGSVNVLAGITVLTANNTYAGATTIDGGGLIVNGSIASSSLTTGNRTEGDPVVVGSHDLSARTVGFAAGMDYRLAPGTVAGFALAGGGTRWDLAQGLGGGRSDAFQAGVYGATRWGPAYLAAAFAFANHWMSTDRAAPFGNRLTADFDAQSFGGRVEGGYRFVTPIGGVTPYAAVRAQSFRAPGYSEVDVTGGGFGLAYNSRTGSDTRSELGARFDHLAAFVRGAVLTLRGRLAWAHDWVSDPTLAPTQ